MVLWVLECTIGTEIRVFANANLIELVSRVHISDSLEFERGEYPGHTERVNYDFGEGNTDHRPFWSFFVREDDACASASRDLQLFASQILYYT